MISHLGGGAEPGLSELVQTIIGELLLSHTKTNRPGGDSWRVNIVCWLRKP